MILGWSVMRPSEVFFDEEDKTLQWVSLEGAGTVHRGGQRRHELWWMTLPLKVSERLRKNPS